MQIIKVKLTELHKPETNVRMHTQKQIAEFERSVKMFGQIRPIVIDENNVIIAGNGLFETLIHMGADTAECVRYKNLSENQKKKLMIADNKVFQLGVDNYDALDKILSELGDDLDIPGYDEDVLRQMTSEAEAVTETVSQYGTIDQAEVERIRAQRSEEPQAPAESAAGGMQEAPSEGLQGHDADEERESSSTEETAPGGPQDEQNGHRYIICPHCGKQIWL